MREILTITIILLFHCIRSFGTTYWIAPKGQVSAKGSMADPFPSIETALQQVGGGNTFIFKPGYYAKGQIMLLPQHSGSPEEPTIFKSQYKYEAIIHGSTGHNIDVRKGCDWVIIDGFDIGGGRESGVLANADHTVIRNCRIHNNGLVGIEAYNHNNIIIENNLIEYNGKHPHYDHGVYVAGKKIVIRNNIVRFNSGYGLHLYPKITNSRIENNLIYGNYIWGICMYSANEGGNQIVNNTVAQNGGGIVVVDGKNEIIANNIVWKNRNEITANSTRWPDTAKIPIKLQGNYDISNIKVDYNLCMPRSKIASAHGFSADPLFLDPVKGVFFLNKGSPAIMKGSGKFSPSRDFFGNAVASDKLPDLGCFPSKYSRQFSKKQETFCYGWPYFGRPYYGGTKTSKQPDLWSLP